jgi:5-hydroxyisourate hydrolase
LASGRLTTHVLDTANGMPARGVRLDLSYVSSPDPVRLKTAHTNTDGRCDTPLLEGEALIPGWYELVFDVGNYFASRGVEPGEGFLGMVPVRFQVTDAEALYHVPLLVSPFGYSTYRGS